MAGETGRTRPGWSAQHRVIGPFRLACRHVAPMQAGKYSGGREIRMPLIPLTTIGFSNRARSNRFLSHAPGDRSTEHRPR